MKTLTKKQQEILAEVLRATKVLNRDEFNMVLFQALATHNDKSYSVTTHVKDGKMLRTRFNSGYNVLELIGILEETKIDIIQNMKSGVKSKQPVEVKRYFLNNDNL